jgi:surfeit locus 1 family protein
MPNDAPSSDSAPPRRFRPRALPALATIVAVVIFVAAGHWQQRRMHEKESLRARFDAASALAPVALAELPVSADWNSLRYRAVTATGEYDARRQILLDNRVHDGHAGYDVIAPLVLADGRAVLVNRGWTPQGASRAKLPNVAPPPGTVTVRGRIVTPATRVFRLAKDAEGGPSGGAPGGAKGGAPGGAIWQNIDPARFAATTGMAVLPVLIEATDAALSGRDDGLVRDWAAPDFGVEKHEIYLVQWYAFAALAIALWAILNLRRPKRPGDE